MTKYIHLILLTISFCFESAMAQTLTVEQRNTGVLSVSKKVKDGVISSRVIMQSPLKLSYKSNMDPKLDIGKGYNNGIYIDTLYFYVSDNNNKRLLTISSYGYPSEILKLTLSAKSTEYYFVYDPNKSSLPKKQTSTTESSKAQPNVSKTTVTSNQKSKKVFNEAEYKKMGSPVNLVIPDGFTEIDNFWHTKNNNNVSCTVQSVTIPNTVTHINPHAFNRCKNLVSITIPNSVISIGGQAFMYCEKLHSVALPSSLTAISMGLFTHCKSLTTIVIPNNVTSIGGQAFFGCVNLTSVLISSSVSTIYSQAFCYCSMLSSITIPNTVENIGTNVFGGCTRLTSINISKASPVYERVKIEYNNKIKPIL